MGFYDTEKTWCGRTVVDWTPEYADALTAEGLYRIRLDWEDKIDWTDQFAQFLSVPDVGSVTGLVVGAWGGIIDRRETLDVVVQAIVGAREKLPNLTMLFVADVAQEESEISWIQQTDLSPLFNAFPNLEHFGARGGQGLSLGIPRHARLKSLAVEAGGLPVSVVEEISSSELPSLEYLEIYLGDENYGADSSVSDLHTILHEGRNKWPNLRYLGLRNCEYANEIAEAITTDGGAPLLTGLETLDLSLGTLGDTGVRALAACPAIAKLKKLDIHHHFATEEALAELNALGIEVDASDVQNEDDEYRYVAVSE